MAANVNMAVFWVVPSMEAVNFSETSLNFYRTPRRYNPEHSRPQTRRRENLKSFSCKYLFSKYARNNVLSGSSPFRHEYFICSKIL
jgi:hypothetical protein